MSNYHRNYIEVIADSHFDLGIKLGSLFHKQITTSLNYMREDKDWNRNLIQSQKLLKLSQEFFPQIVEEVQGYAKSLGIGEVEMFQLTIEDEYQQKKHGRCTTIVSNGGDFIAHNEDWDPWSKDAICLVKKTIDKKSIFEFYYYGTLGGNSISINNNGIIQAINSLSHIDHNVGIPKNIIARWLSASRALENDLEKLQTIPRSSGHHHTLIDNENIFSVESTAQKLDMLAVCSPFIHTNHYLRSLKTLEREKIDYSQQRFDYASKYTTDYMSEKELKRLLKSQELGNKKSLFNERTIGQMIIDRKQHVAMVWMAQESERGWVRYPLEVTHG